MFTLGGYYAQNGDRSLAVQYYDSAARAGTPKIRLKAAQALDVNVRSTEPPLDLEKAGFWYAEVLKCDNSNLQLEAAIGLDEMSDEKGRVIRPAFDMERAYLTYRTLAAKGSPRACFYAAYCNEIGKGTIPNPEIALQFYKMAGREDIVRWLQEKKSNSRKPSPFEEQRDCQMPERTGIVHSPDKELYTKDFDTNVCEYDGRIYYLNDSYKRGVYLCSSDPSGADRKILLKVDRDYNKLQVNVTGIYLYDLRDYDRVRVRHLGFDGQLISECCEDYEGGYEAGHSLSNIYIYDNHVYYVHSLKSGDRVSCQIQCMDVDEGRVRVLYEKANEILRLFAVRDKLIFLACYENEECERSQAEEWMLLDLIRGTTESLSNPYCNPENILDDPEIYDEESGRYQENCRYDRKIISFDLNRGIFWTEREELNGPDGAHLARTIYWEPRFLWGDRDLVCPDLPIWKMPAHWGGYAYFDGTCYYYAQSYNQFKSRDRFGNLYDWDTSNGGHGCCENFRVMGDCLYLDVDAYGEKQYSCTIAPSEPMRESWFQEELPQEMIERFQNGEYRTAIGRQKRSDVQAPDGSDNTVFSSPGRQTPASEDTGKGADLYIEKTIGKTDVDYNICTFGAKFHIGFGVPVTIEIGGRSYSCRTHKSVKGRIDGMKKLYAEHGIGLGDVLRASYTAADQTIRIER